LPEGNSILDSREQNRTTSIDNLPRINQRRQVEADNIHLQFGAVAVVNHGAYCGILDLAVVQVHADFVAYLKIRAFGLWLAREGM